MTPGLYSRPHLHGYDVGEVSLETVAEIDFRSMEVIHCAGVRPAGEDEGREGWRIWGSMSLQHADPCLSFLSIWPTQQAGKRSIIVTTRSGSELQSHQERTLSLLVQSLEPDDHDSFIWLHSGLTIHLFTCFNVSNNILSNQHQLTLWCVYDVLSTESFNTQCLLCEFHLKAVIFTGQRGICQHVSCHIAVTDRQQHRVCSFKLHGHKYTLV